MPPTEKSSQVPQYGFVTYFILFLAVMVINVLVYCCVTQQWELFKILASNPIFFLTYVVFTTYPSEQLHIEVLW